MKNNVNKLSSVSYQWESYDYHPHRRGWLWILIFVLVIAGTSIFSFTVNKDPIFTTVLLFGAAFYFFIHMHGDTKHSVSIGKEGILVDKSDFFDWGSISKFWFVVDHGVSMIYFERNKYPKKIKLQLGKETPEILRKEIQKVSSISESIDRGEPMLDLWVRILKL